MTATVSAETSSIEYTDEIKTFSPDCLVDHPANPPDRVLPPNVKDLLESIEAFDQRDPVRARVMDEDRLQILSGHRRVAACRILGRDVRVEVVVCDDAEALREVMLGNAEREDLDPVDRAELLQTMIDSGINRDDAGAMFGLMSESGIKNALRISKLPASIKKLLKDGTIPARTARYLVPYASCPKALDDLAADLEDKYLGAESLGNLLKDPRSVVDDLIRIDGKVNGHESVHARPIDGKTKYRVDWNWEEAVCKFEIDAATRKKLKVVEIPWRSGTIEVATNVKLFDRLNQPHLVKRDPYGSAKKKTKKPAGKKLTPKQQAAEDARRRKEADKKLADRLPTWAVRFMRCMMSFDVDEHDAVIDSSLAWLLANMRDERLWLERVVDTQFSGKYRQGSWVDTRLLFRLSAEPNISTPIWRGILWPQLRDDWTQSKGVSEQIPKDLPLSPTCRDYDGIWPTIHRNCESDVMSLEGAWKFSSQGPVKSSGRDTGATSLSGLVREYLELHTTEQLQKVAKAAKYRLEATTKGKRVDELMASHHKKPLPAPKCLAALMKKGAKS
ncbi:MAG: ParB/RepB/Spo0J family partition protein [Planctomycetota bacterium]